MSEKSRKSEPGRGSAAGLSQLGGAPGMVPHHSPYSLPTDSISIHPQHAALTYGIMRPSIGSMGSPLVRPGAMSNDLGPPIFMPSLNLGIPKQQNSTSGATQPSSGPQANSKTKHNNLTQSTTAYMPDIMFQPVFHATPMPPPPGGTTSYITHTAPHPSSLKQQQSQQLPSHPPPPPNAATSIGSAKPLSSNTSSTQHYTKAQAMPTTIGMTSSNATKGGEIPNASTSHMAYTPQAHMASQYLTGHPTALMTSTPSHSMGTLSKMLMSPSSTQQQQQTTASGGGGGGRQAKALQGGVTEVYGQHGMTSSVGTQGGAPVSKSGSQKVGGYPNTVLDGYSLGGRGTLMGQMAASTLATSGQPTSTATYTDTKDDRPPQPSAAIQQQPGIPPAQPPSNNTTTTSTPATAPPVSSSSAISSWDRFSTAEEKASNIIISVPGLTGKHIAAITNNTTPTVQQTDETTLSAYSSPISQPGVAPTNHHTSSVLANKPGSLAGEYNIVAQNQQQLAPPEGSWGVQQHIHTQQKSNPLMFHGALPPGGGNVGGANPSSGLNSQPYQSRVIPQVPHMMVGGAMSTSGPAPHSHTAGVMGSPGGGGGGHTHSSSPNSSPRPRILRTNKRAIDGSWKVDGHANTAHNPGSPLFSKLRQDLMSSKSIRSTSSGYGGSYGNDSGPLSPTLQEGDGHYSNHVGSVKVEPGELTASPRKKPRKQNVVANDDQYASNVPDGLHSKMTSTDPLLLSSSEGMMLQHKLAEELKKVSSSSHYHHNSVTTRSHRIRGDGSGRDGKEVDVCYLSQLRRCPYPINGVYKIHHRAARNHFRRHADIKHREEEKTNPFDLASDRKTWQRSGGHKLHHFSSQLDEMLKVEDGIMKVAQRLEASVGNLEQVASCQVDKKCMESFKELVQGNIDRSNRIKSDISTTKTEIYKIIDHHQPHVVEILKRFAGKEPPNLMEQLGLTTPSLSPSSNSSQGHHRNKGRS